MKTLLFRFTLCSLISYLTLSTLNPTVTASQPSAGNGTHFCGSCVIDYPTRFDRDSKQPNKQEADQFVNRNYAQTFAANLNVGEPYTVRLIYFLPNGSQPQPDIDTQLDTLIKGTQQHYIEVMGSHGFGRKTFTFETDTHGKAVVHHVDGKFTDAYYIDDTTRKVLKEVDEQFDRSKNIYLIAIKISNDGLDGQTACGTGFYNGAAGGFALIPASDYCFNVSVTAHELGHAFGLTHDYRLNAVSIPSSYTLDKMTTSFCTAEWLEVHRYFNATQQSQDVFNTTVQMLPPSFVSEPNTIRIRFEVTDRDGLHQAQLLTPEETYSGGLIACKRLEGASSTVEFVTVELTTKSNWVSLNVMDVHGNFTSHEFSIDIITLLPPPKAISIPDANLAAAVREALNLAPDTVLTSYTMLELTHLNAPNQQITDLTGLEYAQNLRELWLDAELVNSGAWVSSNAIPDLSPIEGLTQLYWLMLANPSRAAVSALPGLTQLRNLQIYNPPISDVSVIAGLTQLRTLEIFNPSTPNVSALVAAVAELTQLRTLEIWWDGPISNLDVSAFAGLTQLESLAIRGLSITDISPLAGLTQLRSLDLWNAPVSDISPLAGLTQLKGVQIFNSLISDVSPLAGLTQLQDLRLGDAPFISDISPLAGLTRLRELGLWNTSVSDISPLVGLTQLQWLHLLGAPLGYQSIQTHIPTLQSKGVTVRFNNQAYPALLKISGDNQNGVSFVPLSHPLVVEVQDENGSAFEGVPVTFIVTAGGGTLSVTSATTDEKGRAQSTLILGPNLGTNTVKVYARGIRGAFNFHAISDGLPTEYLLSIPAGISLIHVPLKVTVVDGVTRVIESIADLYGTLGGEDNVNLLITYDPKTQGWHSYLGDSSRGTVADPGLVDDKGIIAVMHNAVSIRLSGDALGTNGNSSITLHPGPNLVGVPLRDPRIARVTDLFALEGVRGNVPMVIFSDNGAFQTVGPAGAVIVLDSGAFQRVGQVGDANDIPITGGRSFILNTQEAATVVFSGDTWYNFSEMISTVLPPTTIGIEVKDATPVLALKGSVNQGTHVNKEGFSVTVKNLSTDKVTTTIIGDENHFSPDKWESKEVEYQLTIVDAETGRAAMIGDILEISAQFSNPLIRVQPSQYIVTAEDVKRSRIQLGELVVYEILWETGLVAELSQSIYPRNMDSVSFGRGCLCDINHL